MQRDFSGIAKRRFVNFEGLKLKHSRPVSQIDLQIAANNSIAALSSTLRLQDAKTPSSLGFFFLESEADLERATSLLRTNEPGYAWIAERHMKLSRL